MNDLICEEFNMQESLGHKLNQYAYTLLKKKTNKNDHVFLDDVVFLHHKTTWSALEHCLAEHFCFIDHVVAIVTWSFLHRETCCRKSSKETATFSLGTLWPMFHWLYMSGAKYLKAGHFHDTLSSSWSKVYISPETHPHLYVCMLTIHGCAVAWGNFVSIMNHWISPCLKTKG